VFKICDLFKRNKNMSKHVWEIYRDKAGEWRYRILAENGRNVGSSGDGVKNLDDIYETVSRLRKPQDDISILTNNEGNVSPGDKQFLSEHE
jgi:uncharacterized protein YegP (UPF0339 family)